MKKIVIIVAAVVVIGVIIGAVALVLNGGDDENAVAGLTRTASSNILVQADGVVLPVRAAELSMDFGGVVDAIFVTEGRSVQKGDVLATLERKLVHRSVRNPVVVTTAFERPFHRSPSVGVSAVCNNPSLYCA